MRFTYLYLCFIIHLSVIPPVIMNNLEKKPFLMVSCIPWFSLCVCKCVYEMFCHIYKSVEMCNSVDIFHSTAQIWTCCNVNYVVSIYLICILDLLFVKLLVLLVNAVLNLYKLLVIKTFNTLFYYYMWMYLLWTTTYFSDTTMDECTNASVISRIFVSIVFCCFIHSGRYL